MKKLLKIYLDTTIPNYVFNNEYPDRQRASTILFDKFKKGQIDLYISQTVIDEVMDAPADKRQMIMPLLEGIRVLPLTEECIGLANEYVKRGIIPEEHIEDAYHIAIATVSELDVIVSYNLEHIVKLKTKREVGATNMLLGYRMPEIIFPEEVI